MQVFIMRHGAAAPEASNDSLRALTPEGREQSRRMAHWLRQQAVKIDQLLVSPFLRARQTLEVLREVLSLPENEQVQEMLTPNGDPQQIADYLRLLADQGVCQLLIVSHLPLVGYLVAELCPPQAPLMFATSAITSVTLPVKGHAVVNWQMSPGRLPAQTH